jgi:hypothetical protein
MAENLSFWKNPYFLFRPYPSAQMDVYWLLWTPREQHNVGIQGLAKVYGSRKGHMEAP